MAENKRARNVCFRVTLPEDWPEGEPPTLLDPSLWKDCSYCIYQLELGDETSRLHYQGYLECVGQKTWVYMHENWDGLEGAHFEVRRGTQLEAINYCKKGDTALDGPWEWGEAKEQGKRSDLLDIKRKIDEMQPLSVIQDDHFASFVRHSKFFKEYKRQKTAARNFKTQVWLFIGPPGHGKSTMMKILAPMLGSVFKARNKKSSGLYWDDYDGQDVIILDEFNGARMIPEDFNDLADEHECVLPVHGGAGHQMVSKYLFIGTNYLPRQWWKNRNPAQLRQTLRRIDVVFKMGFKYPSPLEPVYGGQDPTVPLDGFSSYSSNLVREEEIPFWVTHPETMSNMGVVLKDPQPKITEFLSEK